MRSTAATIDEYVAGFPAETQKALAEHSLEGTRRG
jgi:hypothetical protein